MYIHNGEKCLNRWIQASRVAIRKKKHKSRYVIHDFFFFSLAYSLSTLIFLHNPVFIHCGRSFLLFCFVHRSCIQHTIAQIYWSTEVKQPNWNIVCTYCLTQKWWTFSSWFYWLLLLFNNAIVCLFMCLLHWTKLTPYRTVNDSNRLQPFYLSTWYSNMLFNFGSLLAILCELRTTKRTQNNPPPPPP